MAIIRPNKTLILGNGFDLDLGLHTTYADFAASKFWPLEDINAGIFWHMLK